MSSRDRRAGPVPPEQIRMVERTPPPSPAGPDQDGWLRLAQPPKARIAARFATAGQGWRLGLAALTVLALGVLAWALIAYASRRTDEVRREEAARSRAEPSRAERRAAEGARLREQVRELLQSEAERRGARTGEPARKAP